MYLSMLCGMFVCVSLSVNVSLFTVSNALPVSNASAIVRVGGMGWLKPVATVLLRFQRSQPTRGGTVWQQQMPANRDQHLS